MSFGVTQEIHEFVSDPQVQAFKWNYRVDLTASNTQQLVQGQYIVMRTKTPSNKINVVRYIAPYAQYRTDIGGTEESFATILPEDGDGFFSFAPLVNGQSPLIMEINFNAPRTAAGTLNNNDRQKRAGITNLAPYPMVNAQLTQPLFNIPVMSDAEFMVTFEILPPATGSPIPNPYGIGAVGNRRRVDFAGVVVFGATLPQALYNRILEAKQQQGSLS